MGMRNDGQKPGAAAGGTTSAGRTNGFIPSSFRTFSNYLRIVSSGASTVASTVRSAASAVVDRDDDARRDQVLWAGFDKLECEESIVRHVLLLGCRSGFQVWDVEEAHNVRDLVSRHDGPVSFLQMLPKPLSPGMPPDKFFDVRPLLVVCADGLAPNGSNIQDGINGRSNGSIPNLHDQGNGCLGPSIVRFYSVRSQSYVHHLKFRSVVYSVRSSSRVVAVSQAAQIHCFNAATLNREYTIVTNPVVTAPSGSRSMGCGPLAVGPRLMAYSGNPVVLSDPDHVSPQHLTQSPSFPSPGSNGSLVAHYAMESSKQLAAGIVTLGDIGYKKLSRYYSELLPDANHSVQSGNIRKANGISNGISVVAENVGMVIVRDVVSKSVIAQFRAHKSPISALCFDPSGTLLVTASIQGHNINVFRIMPGRPGSSSCDAGNSYVHLYRLQRGLTNAVIQDISFSDDSRWIMISSSRGTNHLFAISPSGGAVDLQFADASNDHSPLSNSQESAIHWSSMSDANQQTVYASGAPVTLSVVSRIRNGSNGWRGTVSGAAAAAAGKVNSLSGAIAASFHHCKGSDVHGQMCSMKAKYHLLVFSPSGSLIQYQLRVSTGLDSVNGFNPAYELAANGCDSRLIVEAIQKWNICQKHNRREREDAIDIYGENGNADCSKIFPEACRKGNSIYPVDSCMTRRRMLTPEERHHLYTSEAELQMHQPQVPLWVKSQICFQAMVADSIQVDEDIDAGGEVEIEEIPTRTIEARSKKLIPVFDYLQNPKYQSTRVVASDCINRQKMVQQIPGLCQSNSFPSRSSSCSLDKMTEHSAGMAISHDGSEDTGNGLSTIGDTRRDFVNSNGGPQIMSKLDTVNSRDREHLEVEAQLKFVHNSSEALKMENRVEDEDDVFA